MTSIRRYGTDTVPMLGFVRPALRTPPVKRSSGFANLPRTKLGEDRAVFKFRPYHPLGTSPATREGSKNERSASFSGEGSPLCRCTLVPPPSRTPERRRSTSPQTSFRERFNTRKLPKTQHQQNERTTFTRRLGDLPKPKTHTTNQSNP